MSKYVLVRREPTEAMMEEGDDGYYGMSASDVWNDMVSASPSPLDDGELVDWLESALDGLQNETEKCKRCDGNGFHHGFGELGHDPDWCDTCGGEGVTSKYPTNKHLARAVLALFTTGDE